MKPEAKQGVRVGSLWWCLVSTKDKKRGRGTEKREVVSRSRNGRFLCI